MSMSTRGIKDLPERITNDMLPIGVRELHEAYAKDAEARMAVTYAAYGLKFGDMDALHAAQIRRRPEPVAVRMPSGALEKFHIDLAITAIKNGGKIEL
jgi:hypothetical protein